jgi:hypothetical protein
MKRTTLFAALASALSLAACAHGIDRQSQSLTGTSDDTSRIPAAKGTSGDTSSSSTESAAGGSASPTDDSRRIPAAKGESKDAPPR